MIRYTTGNLLEADVQAVVNTVNTVGVMGKGIALMFKENFPENYQAYKLACKAGAVETGRMFVTERHDMMGPRWIINFPTKQDWRSNTRLEWVDAGLQDLVRVIKENRITSIAIPPLGCGNGGLDWQLVRPRIEAALIGLENVEIAVFEPTRQYQNVAKRKGVEKLTLPRALIAELVRRYWVLGIECSLLEIQKLGWFLEQQIHALQLPDPLDFRFEANRYGPYAKRLDFLLDSLDGSYLHCDKRLADAGPADVIWFDDKQRPKLNAYLMNAEAKPYREALDRTESIIDGFQSPLGMELMATVDWLIKNESAEPTVPGIQVALAQWPNEAAAKRKLRLFDAKLIKAALDRLQHHKKP